MAKQTATAPDKADPKDEWSTLRLHGQDGRHLVKLAALRNVTVADLFRELCADLVRKELTKELQKQVRQHELGDPGV